jgi:HK97 family phage prohead protease
MDDTLSRQRMAHAFSPLALTSVDADGSFAGYACLFGAIDMGRDVIERGAFARSLATRGASGIRMLFQHDPAQPIGTWQTLREDARGLYCKGRLAIESGKGHDILELLRARAIDGLSIGFRPVRARRDATTGVRRIAEIDLWEISVVTFPMQPDARITAVKARPFRHGTPTEREFERWLTRDAGLTRGEARALMRKGLDGLRSLRDAGEAAGTDAWLSARIRAATRLVRGQ